MGEPVFDLELQEVKNALRGLGTTFEARVFRPTNVLDEEVRGVDPVEAPNPTLKRNRSLRQVFKSTPPPQGSDNDSAHPNDRVFMRNGKPIKCSNSVYCPCCVATRDANRVVAMGKISTTVIRRLKSFRPKNVGKKVTLTNPVFDSQV
jgi:hypothetical protein